MPSRIAFANRGWGHWRRWKERAQHHQRVGGREYSVLDIEAGRTRVDRVVLRNHVVDRVASNCDEQVVIDPIVRSLRGDSEHHLLRCRDRWCPSESRVLLEDVLAMRAALVIAVACDVREHVQVDHDRVAGPERVNEVEPARMSIRCRDGVGDGRPARDALCAVR